MARYDPPKQSGIGQFFDAIFVLVLVYVSLMLPLLMNFGGGTESAGQQAAPPTWESLGQNPTMQAQWEKLGYDANAAAEIINARFDYTIEPVSLIITAIVVIGYFVLLLRFSDREYRDVLEEKFNSK